MPWKAELANRLDDATYVPKDAHLDCLGRFVKKEHLIDELLYCQEIEERTTGKYLFEVVGNFIVEKNELKNYVFVYVSVLHCQWQAVTRDYGHSVQST